MRVKDLGPDSGRIKHILVSQPKPDSPKNPYFDIETKHKVKIDFRQFINVEGISSSEFRRSRVNPYNYNSIIFTSRNSVDHFFRICEEMRIRMPQDTKFFCTSETIALYLQKYMQYRKRRVFFVNGDTDELQDMLLKHREGGKFLLPCSDAHQDTIFGFLGDNGFDQDKAVIYRTVPSDLSDLKDLEKTYDMVVFFSPTGVKSLFKNFPKFKQKGIRIAAFGPSTSKAVTDAGLKLDLQAPAPGAKSMTAAISLYLHQTNK